jgi:hypothetical protein
MSIYPDFTNSESYRFEVDGNTTRNFRYFVENVSENMSEDDRFKEKEFIRKVVEI